MADDEVILLDTRFSSFGMRVRIALSEKGVDYEYREETLSNKSPLLLEMNPVHKKIPVLIHNGKPICESLIILEYIDQVWKGKSPLLPSDPYERAQAKFWADVFDKKVPVGGRSVWTSKEDNRESAKNEFIEALKLFEEKLGDEPYFAGKDFGFLDLAFIPFSSCFEGYEIFGKFSVEEHCPKLVAWVKRCMKKKSVSESLADPKKVYEYMLVLRKRFGID